MAANPVCLNFQHTPILCDFGHILLMEANGDLSPLDIPALNNVLSLCIKGDLPSLRKLANPTDRSRAASAARFILRKHDFAVGREASRQECYNSMVQSSVAQLHWIPPTNKNKELAS